MIQEFDEYILTSSSTENAPRQSEFLSSQVSSKTTTTVTMNGETNAICCSIPNPRHHLFSLFFEPI
jgi:hypothetical protein